MNYRVIGRLGRLLLVVSSVAAFGLVGSGTALAHDSLVSSSPAADESLSAGPAEVTLTFNDVVQNLQPLITVTSANGDHWEGAPVSVLNNTVSVPVNPLGPAGQYTVSYRVISADGHPVEGTVAFSVATAGTGSPNPAVAGPAAPSDAIPAWVWIVGAGLVLVGVVIGGTIGTRRRTDD